MGEGVRNLWAETFVDPGLLRCTACTLPKSIDDVSPGAWAAGAGTCVGEVGKGLEHELALVDIKRFLYKNLFVLQPHLKEGADALQADLGLADERYVGVHIRRGDKEAESGFFRTSKA